MLIWKRTPTESNGEGGGYLARCWLDGGEWRAYVSCSFGPSLKTIRSSQEQAERACEKFVELGARPPARPPLGAEQR